MDDMWDWLNTPHYDLAIVVFGGAVGWIIGLLRAACGLLRQIKLSLERMADSTDQP